MAIDPYIQQFSDQVYHHGGLYNHIMTSGSGRTVGRYGLNGVIELETTIRDGEIRLCLCHNNGSYVVLTDGAATESPSLALTEVSGDAAAIETMLMTLCEQWSQLTPATWFAHQAPRFNVEQL